jgi:hypothetical protein
LETTESDINLKHNLGHILLRDNLDCHTGDKLSFIVHLEEFQDYISENDDISKHTIKI